MTANNNNREKADIIFPKQRTAFIVISLEDFQKSQEKASIVESILSFKNTFQKPFVILLVSESNFTEMLDFQKRYHISKY